MPSVLVTGASRGIGKAIVEHLAARGWDVIAGVRSQQDADAVTGLSPQRISSVILDVTSADDIAALDGSLPERLDAIVNNAGIAVGGAMETLSPDEWRKQLEINVIGALAVTQAVLPRLRKSRGRIVFISSVNGRLSMPLIGAYAASKFALEAAADALRMELSPWKIRGRHRRARADRHRHVAHRGRPWSQSSRRDSRRSTAICTPSTSPA